MLVEWARNFTLYGSQNWNETNLQGVSSHLDIVLKSVLNFGRVSALLDLGECLSLDADNLPSAVHLSLVQTLQVYCENLRLKRYWGDILGH